MGAIIMKIQQLEYIIAIAQAGSITAAARNLYQAQPNISIALKDLESEIGMQIFWRTPNGMVLTPEGEAFLTRAKDIVESMHSLEADYTNRSEEGISLKIALSRSSYISSAVGAWVNTLDQDERVKIAIHNLNTNGVIDDVNSGKADIGFIRLPESRLEIYAEQLKNRKLMYRELIKFRLKILVSSDSPLAKLDKIPIGELKKYIEIGHGDDELSAAGRVFINSEYDAPSDMHRINVQDMGGKIVLLEQIPNSYMWSPPMTMDSLLAHNSLVLRESDYPNVDICDLLIFKKSAETNRVIKAFVDFVSEFAVEIARKEEYIK